jgi:hypothetical protein
MHKPKIMYYHDGRHPHIYRYEPPMHKEEYIAMVDELAGTPIEAISLCLGEGRTMLHDTKASELMGHNIKSWDHIIFRRAWQNAKHLIDSGHDPLRIVCDRAHELGIQVYPALIVQRGGVDHASVRCSNFRINNQHLEIGAAGDVASDHPGFDGLDMKHKEVRDERFAIVEEAMSEYPTDGFELQLNNMPYFFHPNEIKAGRSIITDWIGRVHETVKKNGAHKELAVHIPDRFEDCLNAGLDPEEWVKQGIVDVIIPETCGDNYSLRLNGDYTDFISLTRATDCRVLGPIASLVASDRLLDAPITMIRAMACSCWEQGVDGLYVTEWFRLWPYDSEFYEKLRELPYPSIMDAKDKFYYLPTQSDRNFTDPERNPLPRKMALNQPVEVTLKITDDLHKWGTVGRVHEVLLRLRIGGNVETDTIQFKLNGKPLPETLLRKINQLYVMDAPRHRVMGGYWYIFKLDAEHWPLKGENQIQVELLSRDTNIDEQYCTLSDIELETKYLQGKNFHRAYVDPDLGPYDHRS